ncbi:MAG: hypothetical protein Q9M36_08925 [Sulfurovum sp.]|nr:hypothetical protein [Sulfurovum sp.]
MKKILHITNWYPNKWNHLEGLFVQEHFKLFSEDNLTHLIHVEVRNGQKVFDYEYIRYSEDEEGYYLLTKITSTKLLELLTSLLLLWVLFKSKYNRYDAHIFI